MLDEARRDRLRRAGRRFREAQHEQKVAMAELKEALAAADGETTAQEAADLTGLDVTISSVLLGHR